MVAVYDAIMGYDDCYTSGITIGTFGCTYTGYAIDKDGSKASVFCFGVALIIEV